MVLWCDLELGRYSVGGNWWVPLALTLMLACFACVLWFSLATNRDGFWVSFLLCVGVLLSLLPLESFAAGDDSADLGYAFVTLCHCNVHPVSLCLVVVVSTASMLFCESEEQDSYGMHFVGLCDITSWSLIRHRFHTCVTECLLLAAFTMDFSNRIQAVATGVLYGSESNSAASALLQSPAAGRSGRPPCWLAGLFSWLWWLIDFNTFSLARSDAEQLRLSLSSSLVFLLVCALSAYSWRNFHARGADIVLGMMCHLPAMMTSVELVTVQGTPFGPFRYPLVLQILLMHVLATQTLVQAGCHPGVCAAFTLPLCVFALWEQALFAGDLSRMDKIHVRLLMGPVVCLVLICSHFIDYFARMKAIQEGFASSAENARTREHLAAPAVEQLGTVHLGSNCERDVC